MAITRYTANGYWKDRMGFKRSAISLSGVASFDAAKTFLTAMKAYSNLALLRVVQSAQTVERVAGETPGTGHFDLGNYVAKLAFYNFAAEDAGDSPGTTLTIAGPKDDLIEETKDGIWIVKDESGVAIANLMATALGLSQGEIEFVSGEVPEN